MLILFLQIMGHCGKYETTYIERIITTLLMSSGICSCRTSRENVLDFLLPENNSHVAVPIHKISFIELFLLKQ
jgi:hypothetical protein